MKTKIVSLISLLGTGFYLLGGFDNALECLIVVVILDYITGVISAWYNKKLDSDNLITLCRMHHEGAEKGIISKEDLYELLEVPPGG